MDWEKFFDTINQRKLMEVLGRDIKDGRDLSLIKYLKPSAVRCGRCEETTLGVPLGAVSNVILRQPLLARWL